MEDDENEAIDEDPTFYRGTGVFKFTNGDQYKGEYIAHSSGLVWREGKGVYKTHDGQEYSGTWYNDQLKDSEETEISYPNNTCYVGHVDHRSQYIGPAMYTVQKGLHILCRFVENKPVGDISLLDTKGREWRATAGERDALLLPEHTFFNDIPARLGKGTLRIQKARCSFVNEPSWKRSAIKRPTLDQEALNRLEVKIFARTKKTVSDLKFQNSMWYENWLSFRKCYDRIIGTVRARGEDGLCQDERDWLSRYNDFKEKYRQIMDSRGQPKYKDLKDYKLFELYNTTDYLPPIAIYTACCEEPAEAKAEVTQSNESYFARSFAYQM